MSTPVNEIQLTQEEALKIIAKLDQIVVSLDRIKSHHAKDQDFAKHDKALADYIIQENVNKTLAHLRAMLSEKFSSELADDDMDIVERACMHNTYWTAKKENAQTSSIDMQIWHEQHTEKLIHALVNEFEYLYLMMQDKKQHIYGFVLNLDSDCITAYSAVSTLESLEDLHKNKEWDASEWCWCVDETQLSDALDDFLPCLINHYWDDIVPLFNQGFDYEPQRQKNIQLFCDAMQSTKQKMIEKYGKEIEEMVFFLSIPGDPIIVRNSALLINATPNTKVEELLESLPI